MVKHSEFQNIVDLLNWRTEQHPEAVAFRFFADGVHESAQMSYADLHRQSCLIAARLQAAKLSHERVLIFYPPGLDFISAFIGCLYAEAIPVPAYPPEPHRLAHTLNRLQSIIQDAQSPAVLTNQETLNLAQKVMRDNGLNVLEDLQWLQTDPGSCEGRAEDWKRPVLKAESLAFLQYTSGSTSTPKGVMISHGNLLNNHRLIETACEHLDRQIKMACWVPFYHDLGLIFHLLYSLYLGGETLVMPPLAFIKNPFNWLKLISDHQATSSGAPNFAYDLCVRKITPQQRDSLDLSHFSVAVNGGEPIDARTVERFIAYFAPCGFQRQAYFPSYGMAESTLFIAGSSRAIRPYTLQVNRQALAAHRVEISETEPTMDPGVMTLLSSGQAWLDEKICIVAPETGLELPEDQVGEIWVQGQQVAQGYWHNTEATQETFQAQLKPHKGPFLRTGDLGFLHQAQLFVTGRSKDLIIVHGRNLYPQDLERSIDLLRATYPEIRPGCGIAFEYRTESQEQVVFFQEVTPVAQPEALCQSISETLTRLFTVSVHAVVLVKPGSLPKTTSGKLMRQACKAAYGQNLSHSDIIEHWQPHLEQIPNENEAPKDLRSWLIQWLARETQRPLNQIEPRQSFESLGLDSLLAVRLIADLEEFLGQELPDTLLWNYASPGALLDYLRGEAIEPLSHIGARGPAAHNTELQAELQAEPIAIIGMACRFPGGINSPQDFWRCLEQEQDVIRPIPSERWPNQDYYAPEKGQPGKTYVREGGFLEQIDGFEPQFFQISPREAENMDPQQRILMELAWETLEQAGLKASERVNTETGVFIGQSHNEYSLEGLFSGRPEAINAYSGTGSSASVTAGRIAYWLGLQGPVVTIDTACSSALVAVHQACQNLRLKACNLALAGGVNLMLSPEATLYFSQLQALAQDSRCKSFDASADGFVRSEGCGLVALKRLADAQRDGDQILGLIRASGVNHNGHSNGLTAPNGLAQSQLIQKTLAQARLQPEQIGFVETHGTGTPLGDPIEIEALKQVLLTPGRTQPLYIGAVKSNLGHMESASGMAGLIKVILALQHRAIPANLHFQHLNPQIPAHRDLHFPTEMTAWEPGTKRFAGLSAFGISGTNAHLILEEAAPHHAVLPHTKSQSQRSWICLSAHSPAALKARQIQLSDWLQLHQISLEDLAYTTTLRREHLKYRWMTASDQLDTLPLALETKPANPLAFPRLAFVFSGQGSQWLTMGQELFAENAVFKATILDCDTVFQAETKRSLRPYFESDSPLKALAASEALESVEPLWFALQIGLSSIWQSWGVQPQLVIGHSSGELAAAYIAGALSLQAALQIVIGRSPLLPRQNRPAKIPMISTVSEKVPQPGDLESVQAVTQGLEQGINLWIEISPEPVLLSLIRETAQSLQTEVVTLASLRRTEPEQESLEQSLIQYYLAGGDIVWPSQTGQLIALPNYPWQRQSYWLEHKTKAATGITLKQTEEPGFLSENQPESQARPSPPQCIHMHWEKSPAAFLSTQQAPLARGYWLVFSDQESLHQSLELLLQPQQQTCVVVLQGPLQLKHSPFSANPARPEDLIALYQELNRRYSIPLNGIVYAWKPGRSGQGFSPAQAESNYLRLLSVIKSLQALPSQSFRFYLLTQGASPLSPEMAADKNSPRHNKIELSQAMLWGFSRSAYYDYPCWDFSQIDLSPEPSTQEYQLLAHELLAQSPETNVVLRDQQRYVARISHCSSETGDQSRQNQPTDRQQNLLIDWILRLFLGKRPTMAPASKRKIDSKASYLISGGLGVLGLSTAQWLVDQGARHLMLVGRNAPTQSQAQAIEALKQQGVAIVVYAADISDQPQVRACFQHLKQNLPPLKGIVQAKRTVFADTVSGSWHLHQSALSEDLDFFIAYSSVSALLGMPGQAHEAAANAFMDALMQTRRQLGLPALSINWGPWVENDLAPRQQPNNPLRSIATYGFHGLREEQARAFLEQLLNDQAASGGLLALNMSKFFEALPQARHLPLLNYLAREQGLSIQPKQPLVHSSELSPELSIALPTPKQAPSAVVQAPSPQDLEHFISQGIAHILKLPVSELKTGTLLRNYGFDSLMALELKAQIETQYGLVTEDSVRFQSMSIQEICQSLQFKG